MIHYPPRFADGRVTAVVKMLEDAGVSVCIYGHLHGRDLVHGFQGDAGGIHYMLVSVDNIDFKPVPVP